MCDGERESAGFGYTCGVREDGSLWCWGSDNYGNLGLGGSDGHATPQQVGEDTNWRAVAAGGLRTFGLRIGAFSAGGVWYGWRHVDTEVSKKDPTPLQ